jgi:hypothetical protein
MRRHIGQLRLGWGRCGNSRAAGWRWLCVGGAIDALAANFHLYFWQSDGFEQRCHAAIERAYPLLTLIGMPSPDAIDAMRAQSRVADTLGASPVPLQFSRISWEAKEDLFQIANQHMQMTAHHWQAPRAGF